MPRRFHFGGDWVVSVRNFPTETAFLAKNDFLVLEKNGIVLRVKDNRTAGNPLLKANVSDGFCRGLPGMAIEKPYPNGAMPV